LVELLVSMSVLVIALAMAFTCLISILTNTRREQERADAVSQARLALAQIDRQVRSGNVLYDPATEALPMSMRIYTQANGDQRCVQWQITGQRLRTRSWTPDQVSVSAWRTVALYVVNDSTQPPFRLQGGGTAFASRLLDVRLFTRVSAAGGPAVELRSSLSGRNTVYGYDASVCSPVPA
jgi:type II secretory pathway pseudopilin PulG